MNLLILAAGYATRLYPLTEDRAKPLVEVAGRSLMDWLMEKLTPAGPFGKVCVVTNHKFARDFQAWAERYSAEHPGPAIEVVDDGSTRASEKLGAIADINLAIIRAGLQSSDLIVVGGDNLFQESLASFGACARTAGRPLMAIYDTGTLKEAACDFVVTVDESGTITALEEKPVAPGSTLVGTALYYYPREVVAMVPTYLAAGNHPDEPGRFILWLHQRTPVGTWRVPGHWFDVGCPETVDEAGRVFSDRKA